MMHTTYSTSIFSLTTFHDYSNERCPSTCSSCYCSIPINSCQLLIPTNPRFLYGLRQSILIQCPPSRRFLSGSGNRYCSRSPVYDVGRCQFFDSCCVKQERVERVGRHSCESKCSGTWDCSQSPVYDVGRCWFFDSCCVEQERVERVGRHSCESKCSGTWDCSRSPVYDVGRCRCFESCCVKPERVERFGRNSCESKCCIKEKKKCVSNVEGRMARPRRNLRVYDVGDAEAMLSLLSEYIVEECVVLKEKKEGFRQGGKVVSKRNVVIEELRDGNEYVGSRHMEGKPSNEEIESTRVPFRDEGYKRKEERYDISTGEDQRLKRRESGSSYYSVSDSGDFGSDIEVEIAQEQLVGESSTKHKKNEGVVISEEARQGSEKFGDDKDQELRSSRRDDCVVGSSIQQNWRKKSEKKLAEESEESNHRSDSALRQSQLSKAKESSAMIAFRSKKNINFQEEQSTSDVKSHVQSSALNHKDNRVDEYLKSNIQRTRERENIGTSSTSWRRSRQDSEIVDNSILETRCQYCKTCGRSMEERKTQLDFQQLTEQSKTNVDASLSENQYRRQEKGSSSQQSSVVEESNLHGQMHIMTEQASAKQTSQHHLETISSSDACAQSTVREQQSDTGMQSVVESSRIYAGSQSESRRGKEEKSTSSIQTSAMEEKRQHDQTYLETSHVDARRKSQHRKETMEDDGSLRRSNLRSQRQSETRMKHLEEQTTSVSVAEELKRLREESSKESHTEIGHSRVHSLDLEINSQSISDKRAYNEQIYSKTKVQSLEELVEKRKRIEETIVQSTIRTEAQEPSAAHVSSEATVSQSSAPSISRIGAQKLSGEETKSKQLPVTSPAYQYESQYFKASSSGMRNDIQKIEEVGSSSTLIIPQARSSSSYGEIDDTEGKSTEEYSPENALASAARMQESSTHIIGHFVEQMSHEASTSETSSEKFSKLDWKHPDEKHLLKSSSQPEKSMTGLQSQGSELSSRVSTPDSEKKRSQIHDSKHNITKESPDPVRDVKDHFVQEAPERESSEGAKSETVAAVRTGKFLWNIVANICRFRWGPHSENEKSPVKKRSSPTGSSGGETWFSGDEVDDANGNGAKADKGRLLQGSTSGQSPLQTTTSQKEEVVVSLEDKLSHGDGVASSSSSTLQSSSLSGGTIVGGSTNLDIPQLMPLPSSSVCLSVPSAKQLRRSLAFEELDEEENIETPVSSSEERRDSMLEERQSDVSPSEGTDVSLSEGEAKTDSKRRLQRSKLVLQRFDEWQDAYRREREQKKVDEIFMREALSEAIKAADSWEVPVGAVLVQNGKIIARGYNLVEELRDSTAHAEMICIREASNVLHTWRLSETTLYVTLEPCPMCAGAILQARINTLVWGAPNKLLGADGSWIRLFPEGPEGDERSELADKPAAPVHPFHPKMNIRRGILQEECADIMQQFFQLKRRKAKPKPTSSEGPPQPTCFPRPKHKSKLLYKMHNVFHPSNPPVD